MGDPAAPHSASPVSLTALFLGFFKVGLSGFGGVLPFARRMLVDEHQWLTEHEFIDVLSLSQFLPGPNIVNVSIIVGRRFQGIPGSAVACVALLLMPLVIVLALATIYSRFADISAVRGACSGISSAASGLILAMGLRMAQSIAKRRWQVAIGIAAFIGIGIVRVPLLWLLAALAPLSIAIAWRTRR